MATFVEVDGKKPGRVQNRQIIAKTRAVVTKFDPPTTWDDLTTEGFSEDLIDRYEVTLRRGGVDLETQTGKGTRYVWPMTKAEAALTGYGFRARAIIEDLEPGVEDAATGSVTPEPITVPFTDITGSIDYSQSGSLGMSRYGTTTQMNASPAKDGDIWINTSFSPTRVYRRVAGSWVYQVSQDIIAGTIIADAVVAGAIDGHSIVGATITGGTIRTGTSGNYIEMTAGLQDRIRFHSDILAIGGALVSDGTSLSIFGPQASGGTTGALTLHSGGAAVVGGTYLEVLGQVRVGNASTAPAANSQVSFYFNSTFGSNGAVVFKKSNGATITIEFPASGNKAL